MCSVSLSFIICSHFGRSKLVEKLPSSNLFYGFHFIKQVTQYSAYLRVTSHITFLMYRVFLSVVWAFIQFFLKHPNFLVSHSSHGHGEVMIYRDVSHTSSLIKELWLVAQGQNKPHVGVLWLELAAIPFPFPKERSHGGRKI